MTPLRPLVLWLPDWPVRAALSAQASGVSSSDVASSEASSPGAASPDAASPDDPVAVVQANTVIACSPGARAQGVRRGQRRRDAQSRSPRLRLLPADPQRDESAFLPVLRLLEEHVPGVQAVRPGLAALRARGAARYYGGEDAAASRLIELLAAHGQPGARAGVADGLFTAEQAARRADPVLVIPPGGSAAFLGPLPIAALDDDEFGALLPKLGVRSLADFAALAPGLVHDRFGERGLRLQRLAAGADSRPLPENPPPPELAREIVFETPLEQADQIAFAVRRTADAVMDALAEIDLICTEIRVVLIDDDGAVSSREWLHPTSFEATDLVDRVRWQLEGDTALRRGVAAVRLVPTRVDDSTHHQPGLFGQGPGERLHHAVSRVQSMLGHRGVVAPAIIGGRRLADRQSLRPWGDPGAPSRDPGSPWPGSLPPPYPSEVFSPPIPVHVVDATGVPPRVDERGILSAPPAEIEHRPVLRWAGPWPLRERAWDPQTARHAQRFQIVDAEQRAWLALWEDDAWWAEGRYR